MNRIITLSLVMATAFTSNVFAQNVGIAEPAPDSKLDIVQTELTGSSIEVTHNIATNGSSAVFIKNSGTNRALHVQNLLANHNTHVARFLQMGNGAAANGVLIEMNNTTVAGTAGLLVAQNGLGFGGYVLMPAGNAAAGLVSDHLGSGDGLQIYQGGTGDGVYNDVTAGLGMLNVIRSNNIGVASLLTTAGGTGEFIDLDIRGGAGVNVVGVDNATTPTAGGDIYSFFTTIRTATPTTAGTVYGAALAANQSGVGHGILINHSGAQGRNADAAIFAIHRGPGSAILAQNQDNTITGTISVADIAYTGTDVDDHVAIEGNSAPAAGWGIGVLGSGGWYGVACIGDMTATGVKPFTIDHPADPANKTLKHFAIESNEVLNMYRGVIELDANGEATVILPDYFSLINKDYSYQLTAIGTSQSPYVKAEIENNKFVVAGTPGTKVSWTVYADRNDPYMQQNPERGLDVVEKEGERKGKYFAPELYDQPASSGMFYKDRTNTTQTTNIQMPKEALESIEKLDSKSKQAPVRPEVSTNGTEDLQGTK